MGGDSDNVGWESNPESGGSLSGYTLFEAVEETSVRELAVLSGLHPLKLGLEVVKGEGEGGADYSRAGGGEDSGHEVVVGDASGLLDGVLEHGERNKLSNGDRDGSSHSRRRSSPEGVEALLLDDSSEGIKHSLVVSSFVSGEGRITLESYKDKVGGVSDNATEDTGGHGKGNFVNK